MHDEEEDKHDVHRVRRPGRLPSFNRGAIGRSSGTAKSEPMMERIAAIKVERGNGCGLMEPMVEQQRCINVPVIEVCMEVLKNLNETKEKDMSGWGGAAIAVPGEITWPRKAFFYHKWPGMHVLRNRPGSGDQIFVQETGLSVQSMQCSEASKLCGRGVSTFGYQKQARNEAGELDTKWRRRERGHHLIQVTRR